MGIIIGGLAEEVQGLEIRSWLDPGGLRLTESDREPRGADGWIHTIVLHTTRGVPGGSDQRPQKILSGYGPTADRDDHKAEVTAGWAEDQLCASAHFVIDFDGSIACVADLLTETTYHAGNRTVNHQSIGIEMYQGSDAELYEGQLHNAVLLVDFLTRRFGIQRQFHWPYRNTALSRFVEDGLSLVGVFGHREASDDRGAGDPGDAIFEQLLQAGYERFDFDQHEDQVAWKARQSELCQQLGLELVLDGVPGSQTVKALLAAGRAHGLWTPRPGD